MAEQILKYNNAMNDVVFKNFTEQDFNVLFALCFRVKNRGTDELTLDYADLKKLMGLESKHIDNTTLTKMLGQLTRKLASCLCTMERPNGDLVDFVLFPKFVRSPENAKLTVSVAPEFAYLLNDFVDGYTAMELKRIIRIDSRYTKTLYRMLKQYKSTGLYSVKIEDFRELFQVPKSYPTRDVMSKIVKPAIETLKDDFPDLTCVPHHAPRRGAPVDRLDFRFRPDKQLKGQRTIFDGEEGFKTIATTGKSKKPKKKDGFSNFHERSGEDETDWDAWELANRTRKE